MTIYNYTKTELTEILTIKKPTPQIICSHRILLIRTTNHQFRAMEEETSLSKTNPIRASRAEEELNRSKVVRIDKLSRLQFRIQIYIMPQIDN